MLSQDLRVIIGLMIVPYFILFTLFTLIWSDTIVSHAMHQFVLNGTTIPPDVKLMIQCLPWFDEERDLVRKYRLAAKARRKTDRKGRS